MPWVRSAFDASSQSVNEKAFVLKSKTDAIKARKKLRKKGT